MLITRHGSNKNPFFKGLAEHMGRKLVFFGYSKLHVSRKEQEWIAMNLETLNTEPVARARQRPVLKLVSTARTWPIGHKRSTNETADQGGTAQ